MNILGIISIIIVFLFVVSMLSNVFTSQKTLLKFSDGTQPTTITGESLPFNGYSENFTYSFWVNVNDWSYLFGTEKIIISRGSQGTPSISLGATENNLNVYMLTYPNGPNATEIPFKCGVNNIPLQKWTCIIVSVNGRSLDIYVNGKLVRTCVMPGVPKINKASSLYINPKGGFSGSLARVKYWSDTINPQQAWNIYKMGPGGNFFSDLLSKYRLQVNFMKGTETAASITI